MQKIKKFLLCRSCLSLEILQDLNFLLRRTIHHIKFWKELSPGKLNTSSMWIYCEVFARYIEFNSFANFWRYVHKNLIEMPHTHMAICQNDIHLKQPRPSIRTSLSFQLASVQSIWSCLPYLPFLPSPRWPIKPRRFLSDPNPIIGYACQWLTDWLTHSLTPV